MGLQFCHSGLSGIVTLFSIRIPDKPTVGASKRGNDVLARPTSMTQARLSSFHIMYNICLMKNHMSRRKVSLAARCAIFAALCISQVLFLFSSALAVEVLVVGDIQYKPVADVVGEIKSTVRLPLKVYSVSDVKERLLSTVEREDARIVVALGKDAVDEALMLPPKIRVVYGLVLAPPKTSRSNTAGVYMSTPVREYINTVRKYLTSIRKISVVGSRDMMNILDGSSYSQVAAYRVSNSSELVNTVNHLEESHALLLLLTLPCLLLL